MSEETRSEAGGTRTVTVTIPGYTRVLTLREGERVCVDCGGTGDHGRDDGGYLRFCDGCFGGIQSQCAFCGQWCGQPPYCRCQGRHEAARLAERQNERARFSLAHHLTAQEALAEGVRMVCFPGEPEIVRVQDIEARAEQIVADGGVRPQYGWACTEEQPGTVEAQDIILNIVGDYGMDLETVPLEARQELQGLLDGWINRHRQHLLTYCERHQIAVLVP